MSAHFRRPLGGQTLTRLRAPVVTDTRDNSQYRDWAHPVSTAFPNCEAQPFLMSSRLAVEVNIGRDYSKVVARAWCSVKDAFLHTDRVLWDGVVYEVQADPQNFFYSDGTFSHAQINLYRTEN